MLENGVFGDLKARKLKGGSREPQGLIPVDTSVGSSQIFGPSGDGAGPAAYAGGTEDAPAPNGETGAYRLNFENAEIKDVVHAVLGEALQLNYTLTPDVAGTITISSARPVGRTQLLSILETTLAAQGFSMVKSGEIYKIGAILNGAGVVDRGVTTTPGYGVSIVPLRFVSVRTMGRLLGGFVIDAEGIRIDSTSNTMVISGPGSKREEVVRTILSFDEDWMQDQTVGIFELRRANPAAVVQELDRVFDAAGSGNGVITFRPITRLKAVMALSRNATL
ncbi:MAG TPA: type II secretion system protein GspD, partial [Methylomirabilota bacterium]|nr:type II secretion system protein GspD [Methylomirabilota bacterium]